MSYCLLVPHYNHEANLLGFLPRLLALGLPILIVDDGSRADSVERLTHRLAAEPNIHFICHDSNRGKGAAVKTGFTHAASLGFTHVIQIDADGQHTTEDVPGFIALSQERPGAIICGMPVFDESVPRERLYGRKITTAVVALETLSLRIRDGLCGFRVYPVQAMLMLCDSYFIGSRMDFDTEILVKAVWRGIPLQFTDTRVVYPEDGVSHFNYLRENWLLVRLHTRLLLGMLLRSPWLVYLRVRGR